MWEFPHFVSTCDTYLSACVREPSVCDVVSQGIERTLGMKLKILCGHYSWLLFIWRISTSFPGAISLQGKKY